MEFKSKKFWIVSILLMLGGIYGHVLRYTRVPIKQQINLEQFPDSFGDWHMDGDFKLDEGTKSILKSNQDLWRNYINSNGETAELFIAYFKDQKYGEQIHSPRHCLPGSGWKIVEKENFYVDVRHSPAIRLKMNKLVVSKNQTRGLMLYWFWTRSGIITNEYHLKFALAKNALFRRPTDAAFIRLNFPLAEDDQDKVLQIASQFISQVFPAIKKILPFEN